MKDKDNIRVFGGLGVEEFEMEERAQNREVQSPGKKSAYTSELLLKSALELWSHVYGYVFFNFVQSRKFFPKLSKIYIPKLRQAHCIRELKHKSAETQILLKISEH